MALFTKKYGTVLCTALFIGIFAVGTVRNASADQIPSGWTASNMRPVGYSDMGGRGGAFKMAIKQVNGRWYLYTGHLWHRGWSIVDVTDAANPKYLKFIPGPANTWTIQMELHDNLMLTSVSNFAKAWGGDPDKPYEEGTLLWDISDPVNPKQVGHWKTGSTGTHRNGYPGGKYAYMAANMQGFLGQIMVIVDVSDPKNPKEAGRFWLKGQNTAAGEAPVEGLWLHGPPVIVGNRAYMGYGSKVVIADISDVSKPKLVGELDISPPFKGGGTAVHGVMPIPGKSVLFANSEAGGEMCNEPLNHAIMVDIKDETKPRLMSVFPLPEAPAGAPFTNYCDKGGRFGPHNINHEYHLPDVEKQGDLIYLTYFNAGLRIFDIKEPRMPKEVAWFVAPTPVKRHGPIPTTKLVSQTEDVLVDTRGNIYITDKQWGLFILRQTGGTQSMASTGN